MSHANSGVTAGTYKSVTVNATGHVTSGSNPTTLSGYGITDALPSSTKYAASASVGGAASSLANFKVTTTTNNAIDTPGSNALAYTSNNTKAAWNYQQTDGGYYCQWYSASWFHEIFGDYRTGHMSVRGNNNGTLTSWHRVYDEGNAETISIGSASGWSAGTPTAVTPNTVVTGGTTTDVPNISKKTVVTGVTKKTVVTSASGATATVSGCTLTLTDGSFSTGDSCTVTTGDSVTVGTAIKAYTSLSTGAACTVTAGTKPSLTVTSKTVATGGFK